MKFYQYLFKILGGVQLIIKKNAPRLFVMITLMPLLVGCAIIGTSFNPGSINEVRFRDRSHAEYDDEVRVTVAVPTSRETEELFGVDLAIKEIQPIWVRVENHSDKTYYFISAATDPNYFSPLEAAYTVHGSLNISARKEMENYFRAMNFRNPILPHTAVSGFVYSNFDEGEKVVQVDLLASQHIKSFTFFVQIPGMRVDYLRVNFDDLYLGEEIVDFNEDKLRNELENLPCCTTNKEGDAFGDPINLVIIGDFHDVAATFARRGWLPAEETYTKAVWKTIKSFLFGSQYRYSPVSPLYFYGRHQDFARQKPRHDIHERNHLRLWLSPMRFNGKPVFVGQISRDIGVRFTTKTWPPVTHKIDPDIDEARHALIEDLLFAQTVAKIGFVKGVGLARPTKPKKNLTVIPYFTDGLRAVLFVERGPISLNQIGPLGWEQPKTFNIDLLNAD